MALRGAFEEFLIVCAPYFRSSTMRPGAEKGRERDCADERHPGSSEFPSLQA